MYEEDDFTEWFDPEEVPARIGHYQWEGIRGSVFWGGKSWQLKVGTISHYRQEAVVRWRGLAKPTVGQLLDLHHV
jgi:hypothetical protein